MYASSDYINVGLMCGNFNPSRVFMRGVDLCHAFLMRDNTADKGG